MCLCICVHNIHIYIYMLHSREDCSLRMRGNEKKKTSNKLFYYLEKMEEDHADPKSKSYLPVPLSSLVYKSNTDGHNISNLPVNYSR